MSLKPVKTITTALINLPPSYANIFDYYETTTETERLYLYEATNPEKDISPPGHIAIFDYQLDEHELELYSLRYIKVVHGHAVYSMTNEGAMFIGYGPNPKMAQAFAFYQVLRGDFWNSDIHCLPTLDYTECALFGDDDCIPVALMTADMYEDEEYLIEDVFCMQYAPGQWYYSHDFITAIEKLAQHIPNSLKVH